MQRRGAARDAAEETFFRRLEEEVQKIAGFTQAQVAALEQRLQRLQVRWECWTRPAPLLRAALGASCNGSDLGRALLFASAGSRLRLLCG